jgi:quinoprotein glucose dehydrogenase
MEPKRAGCPWVLFLGVLISCIGALGPIVRSDDYVPPIAPASEEAQAAIGKFQPAPGLSVELVAAEPLLANPVCFAIDHQGRFFVAETFRLHSGVTDTRGHMYWVEDDLACRSVADRVAMYKKHLGKQLDGYSGEHDRIRLLTDTNGDGKVDKASVFADGFKNLEDGIGAGLLVHGESVYWSCIPDLWLLKDRDHDGKAKVREKLSSGYGVHVGFIGHDLHGLKMGFDGRVYFSIGDRGLNVTTKEGKHLFHPDYGSVLRCEPDGSHLEVFATGLRNPQELAFDELGNWFTCDNNSDGGDQARWTHLVEGGEYGWRIGYQFHDEPVLRGPWNNERLWTPDADQRAAYLIPPIKNFSDGPSGLVFNPGVTRLGDRWKGCFFLCDFRGASPTSGIRTVKLRPKGATFEIDRDDRILWQVLVTDCDFGPDGNLYLTDWVDGWAKPGKGRIYRLTGSENSRDGLALETEKILREGSALVSHDVLRSRLSHPDQRVRLESQFQLVARKRFIDLMEGARTGSLQARVHAIWGLGTLLRRGSFPTAEVNSLLSMLLRDQDPEIRTQTAMIIGDAKLEGFRGELLRLLADAPPRTLLAVSLALSKLGKNGEAAQALARLAKSNADRDPVLRHGVVMGLVGTAEPEQLHRLLKDSQRSVRLAAAVALRRLGNSEVADALNDDDPLVALEAARAINDVPILAAMDRLAEVANNPKHRTDSFLRRVANANFRLGTTLHAEALARLAATPGVPDSVREEIAYMFGMWANPPGRDRVLGLWRPLPKRSAEVAAKALRTKLSAMISQGSAKVKSAIAVAVRRTQCVAALPEIRQLALADNQPGSVRAECLRTLAELADTELKSVVKVALASNSGVLRSEARRQLARIDPDVAITQLEKVCENGSTEERQSAIATLATINLPRADQALVHLFDLRAQGKLTDHTDLDLLEAALKRTAPAVKEKVDAWNASRKKDDQLSLYRECLNGGNPHAGRDVFWRKAEVYCLRCHRVGSAGGEVGPVLTDISKQKTREYLLESIVFPNKQIAKGFESVLVVLEDGKTIAGVLKSEDAKELRLMTAEAKLLSIPKDQIEVRKSGPSAMPEDAIKHLSKRELRDLIEYLVQQPRN